MRNRWDRWSVLLFLLMFSIYLRTQVVEIYTADSGELTAIAAILGIPHPTGYPLYNLLLKAFYLFIPLGGISFRAALLSSVSAALAVIFFDKLLSRFVPRFYSFSGGILLGLSYTFWSQAVVQEVYTLHFFLLLLLMCSAFNYRDRPTDRNLFLLSLFLGFALTHHLMTLLALPSLALIVIPAVFSRKKRILVSAILFFLWAFSLSWYLPIRAESGALFQWAPCNRWRDFLFHISGHQFNRIMFNFSLGEMWEHAAHFWRKFKLQWGIPILLIAVPPGLIGFFRKIKAVVSSIILLFIVSFIFAINYAIIDIEVYYIQAYIPVLIASCLGLFVMERWIRRICVKCGWLIPAFIFIFGVLLFIKNMHDNDRSRNFYAYDYGMNVYNSLPPGALLITQGWSSPFVFHYINYVLHYRPDVELRIDYAGNEIRKAMERSEAKPIFSTVPIEMQSKTGFSYHCMGIVYLLASEMTPGIYMPSANHIIRKRSYDPSDIFIDYHARGLLSKYRYMKGDELLSAGHVDDAMRKFLEAEAISHDNNLVMNNIACIFFRHGFYKEAERLARLSISLQPSFYQAHHNLGNILIRMGKFKEAILEFGFQRDQRFALGRAHEAMGLSCLKTGRYVKAIEEFEDALRFKPGSEPLLLNLSTAYIETNQLEKAKHILDRLLKNNPDSPDVRNNLGIWFMKKGDCVAAERVFRTLVVQHPYRLDVRVNLAVVYGRRERWVDAERLLHEVLREEPGYLKAINNLGLSAYLRGQIETAIKWWKKSLEIEPEQPDVIRLLESAGLTRKDVVSSIQTPQHTGCIK